MPGSVSSGKARVTDRSRVSVAWDLVSYFIRNLGLHPEVKIAY